MTNRYQEFLRSGDGKPKFHCARRAEGFRPLPDLEQDWIREDDTCSYCGSLNPATFMTRLEGGDIQLDPTDKNYKVYVNNRGGESFKMTYRPDPKDGTPSSEWPWVTEARDHTKFYFQHLTREQQQRFVDLLNEKRIDFGRSTGFYVRPFFIAPPTPKAEAV